jgi:hypothetical protein
MKHKLGFLLVASTISAGCAGDVAAPGGSEADGQPVVVTPPAKAAGPKVMIDQPIESAKVALGEPIVCKGRVEYAGTLNPAINFVVIENGPLRGDKPLISSTTPVAPKKQSEGLYTFEARLEGTRLPSDPGRYAVRAVLIGLETADSPGPKGRDKGKSRPTRVGPPAAVVKYEVKP